MNSKAHEIYEEAYKIWNPNKVDTFRAAGAELSMGQREGSYFFDIDGNQYINMHSNGGVFNLGHRNKEIKETIIKAMDMVDAGNHYFPSQYKNEMCRSLLGVSPDNMKYVYALNGGGEAIDAAIKYARKTTRKARIISLDCAFHGSTGLASMAGERKMSEFFNLKYDEELNSHIPYNDLDSLEEILKKEDTAAVLIESIPATAGFPLPIAGYHKEIERLAHKYGALYIADEVQTGLMRSGEMWCCCKFGATPDMIVTGKGLSGGYYPMSAVIMSEECGEWMKEDGFANPSSFNATEIGCIVSTKVIEILNRTSTKENIDMLTNIFKEGLSETMNAHSSFIEEIRQCGVIMGIKTTHPMGGNVLMQALIKNGIWAVPANFDKSTLQFKPGLLMSKETAYDALKILDKSIVDAMEILKIS